MNILRLIIRPLLFTAYGFHRVTGTGAFGSPGVRLVDSPLPADTNPLKQALWKHNVKQFHESSCSVASVAACINAIKEINGSNSPPIDQQDILARVKTGNWRERLTGNGFRGRRGVPLPLLGEIVRESLAVFNVGVKRVDTVQAVRDPEAMDGIKQTLRQRLIGFEKEGNGLLIAHFDQGSFLRTLNIPHISPVGSYDLDKQEVTVLDVDPEVPQPYSVGFDTFYRGLSCSFGNIFSLFGYGSGGYVYIELCPLIDGS
jgi:hypothetical protein